MPKRETLKQAGYDYAGFSRELGMHLLQRQCDGEFEYWFANKNHASYGLIWKNTHLEFARSAPVAAAPAMLAALERFVACPADHNGLMYMTANGPEMREARAALAKAGE